jgi:hypothetical protein
MREERGEGGTGEREEKEERCLASRLVYTHILDERSYSNKDYYFYLWKDPKHPPRGVVYIHSQWRRGRQCLFC